jgi:hypothetical protein
MTTAPGTNTATAVGTADRYTKNTRSNLPRSMTMYAMNEALARDRMREAQHRASRARLAREASAERRYHRPLSARAHRAR